MAQPVKERRGKTATPDKASECCVSCKKKIGIKQDAVECQWCKHWEHKVCSGITDNEYKLLHGISVNIMFFVLPAVPKFLLLSVILIMVFIWIRNLSLCILNLLKRLSF